MAHLNCAAVIGSFPKTLNSCKAGISCLHTVEGMIVMCCMFALRLLTG